MSTASDVERTDATVMRDPVVVDLGIKKAKLLKQLRKGKGKLINDVNQCISELAATGVVSGAVQPVIVVASERSRTAVASPGSCGRCARLNRGRVPVAGDEIVVDLDDEALEAEGRAVLVALFDVIEDDVEDDLDAGLV